jgi:hypothetical protein
LRNKIFVLTEDLQFFYRINKELDLLEIKFKILNFWNKIPVIPSIILTTSGEINRIHDYNKNKERFLDYSKNMEFNKYLLRVLAAHRIGVKKNYSELLFSIDPGTKHFGLVVFLDDYYLASYTFSEKEDLLQKIEAFSKNLQINDMETTSLKIKIGSGIIPMTIDLIKSLNDSFKDKRNMKVFLVNEDKSSKINIYSEKKKFPKHEASALIIALREGLEIREDIQKFKKDNLEVAIFELNDDTKEVLKEIADKLLKGDLPLSISSKMVREHKERSQHSEFFRNK